MNLNSTQLEYLDKNARHGSPILVRVGESWYTWNKSNEGHIVLTTENGKDIEVLPSSIDQITEGVEQRDVIQEIEEGIRKIVKEELNETKFYAFWKNKKHTINGKSLYDAKQQAITKLKIPKSKVGLLAVVNAGEHDKGSFKFEGKINEDSMSPSFRRMYNALDNVIPMVFRGKSSAEITNSPIGRFKMEVMQNKPEAIKQWPKVKKYIDKMFKDINLKKIKDEQQLLKVLDKTAKGMKV